jgi:3-dehydrosphinganine reductase
MTMHQRGHAIISGGSSGIGKALAGLLIRDGWHVTLIARDTTRLENARLELEALRRETAQRVLALSADVSDEPATARAVDEAIKALGPPRAVVACAGVVEPQFFLDATTAVFNRTMEVNYLGAVHLLRAALPAMMAQGKGNVVLVSSGLGLMGMPGYSAYCASKFALRGLAETLRMELKPHGIAVSIVYPPDTDTPQLAEELKLRPAEAAAVAGNAKVLSAGEVARAIVQGMRRGSYAIAPGTEMALLARLNSVLEPALHWYFDRAIDSVHRR